VKEKKIVELVHILVDLVAEELIPKKKEKKKDGKRKKLSRNTGSTHSSS
jgi:hypothetical protein